MAQGSVGYGTGRAISLCLHSGKIHLVPRVIGRATGRATPAARHRPRAIGRAMASQTGAGPVGGQRMTQNWRRYRARGERKLAGFIRPGGGGGGGDGDGGGQGGDSASPAAAATAAAAPPGSGRRTTSMGAKSALAPEVGSGRWGQPIIRSSHGRHECRFETNFSLRCCIWWKSAPRSSPTRVCC